MEFIEEHLGSSTDTDSMELRRFKKLFTSEELFKVLKERKELSNKLNNPDKSFEDFENYINFEKKLLKQVATRAHKSGMNIMKESIESKAKRRILSLYKLCLQRFTDNYDFWLSYIEFCEENNFIEAATAAVHSIVSQFKSQPKVWQFAARYFANKRREMNVALKMLHDGLSLHKDCQLLYTEALTLELHRMKKCQSTENKSYKEDRATAYDAKLHTYVKSSLENIKDCEFYIGLLEILEPYEFTSKTQSFIIDHLLKHHSDKAMVWHVLSQREFRGFHHSNEGEIVNYKMNSPFNHCIKKYKEGIGKLISQEKVTLWHCYLDFLLNQQESGSNIFKEQCVTLLLDALEEACKGKYLSEKYFKNWLKFVNEQEASKVLEKATTLLPHSVDLWKLRMKAATIKGDTDQVHQILKLGVLTLRGKALPLWLMLLRYSVLTADDETMDEIYLEAIQQPPEVSQVIKPQYIEWLSLTKSMEVVRKGYKDLAQMQPYCKELHEAMLKAETLALEINLEALENVHKLQCSQFGKDDINIWLNYIHFYLSYKKDENMRDNIQRIYDEATKNLIDFRVFDFEEQYNVLMNKT